MERKDRLRRRQIYFIKQKLCGIASLVVGIITTLSLNDGFGILMALVGLCLITTRKRVMNFM